MFLDEKYLSIKKLILLIMVSKTLLSVGIGLVTGFSLLRNSKLAEFIIIITGG